MPATPGGISRAQNEILVQLCKDKFTTYVRSKRQEGKGTWKDVKPWVTDQLKKIRDHEEFTDIADKGIQTVIYNKFRNYYNQSLNKNAEPRRTSCLQADSQLLDLFAPPVKGRRLFEAEIKEHLKTESTSIAEYQKLLSQKWDALDDEEQQAYAVRAAAMRSDPDSFHGVFSKGVTSIAEDEDSEPAWRAFQDAWAHYAGRHVPQLPARATLPETLFTIPQNTRGNPIFPNVDLERVSPELLRRIVSAYFSALWEHCKQVTPLDDAAWVTINEDPSKFYDIDKFASLDIKNPAHLKRRDLDDLVDRLLSSCSYSAKDPLFFYSSVPGRPSSGTTVPVPASESHSQSSCTEHAPVDGGDIGPTATSADTRTDCSPSGVSNKPASAGSSVRSAKPHNTSASELSTAQEQVCGPATDEGSRQVVDTNLNTAVTEHRRGRPPKRRASGFLSPALDKNNT
ncbi:hypothetical protein K488DRAFT_89398 [Vararia minispora EC-137]|uniref:Uncharacterized protein n=1 Tax=Vararia minispora EC-137 TaxID=1314806 RepID=A0ACB8QAS1_9AGAM|nr:hypothetical protein K488DRAFT_89398 [Vararia minispora EC-137]